MPDNVKYSTQAYKPCKIQFDGFVHAQYDALGSQDLRGGVKCPNSPPYPMR